MRRLANDENIRKYSFDKLTAEKQRELAVKGGKASGAAKRKKADLKKAMELLLSLDVNDPKIKKQLENLGMTGDNQSLVAFSVFQQAVKGNQKAVENMLKLTNAKDKHDIAEQKERIKALRLENNRKEQQEEQTTEQKLDSYFEKLQEVIKNEP
nr:MAG TPA: hypothetical protein [Caudoviricetes sp.]DAT08444.1 MAG TPA: hypothetical protein [Caudoviricetes sp.]